MHRTLLVLVVVSAMVVGCRGGGGEPASSASAAVPQAAASRTPGPADAFLERLAVHCGEAFEGRITANEPADPNDPFVGKRLVVHVRECLDDEIWMPFHVGDDRSRTWIITRTDTGLRLKHDHRHEDGTDDVLTMYGGETVEPGTERRQEFPADAFTRDLFARENRQVSMSNVWAMEIEPNEILVYELARPGRLFRVEFDLTTPIAPPPAPWGSR